MTDTLNGLSREDLTHALYNIVRENHQNTDSYTAARLADYLLSAALASIPSPSLTSLPIPGLAELRSHIMYLLPMAKGCAYSQSPSVPTNLRIIDEAQAALDATKALERETQSEIPAVEYLALEIAVAKALNPYVQGYDLKDCVDDTLAAISSYLRQAPEVEHG